MLSIDTLGIILCLFHAYKIFLGGAIISLLHVKNSEAQKLSSLTKVNITWLAEVQSEFAMYSLAPKPGFCKHGIVLPVLSNSNICCILF